MKILIISEFFPTGKDLKFSGGVEARAFFITKYLAKKHHVSIVCSRQRGSKKNEKMFGFTVYRPGPVTRYTSGVPKILDTFSRLRFILAAIRLGYKLDADVIDGGNFIAHFIAKEISKKNKKKVIFWYPDVFIGQWLKTSGIIGGLVGWTLEKINIARSADHFIAISKSTIHKLEKNGVSPKKITLIPCGVEEKEFSKQVNKNLNPTILCVSRLAKYKNLKTLILAFAHLSLKIKTARLIIVGSGPEGKNLKKMSDALKLTSKIKLLSNLPREKLIELYKSLHIFSLPSTVEGFGISTIEAAAAGLPYVISDIPTHREVTRGGLGGFLVKPESPFVYSQKFEKLLTDKALYLKKSKEVRNLAKNYNWQDIASETERVYLSVVKMKK